MSIIEKHFYDIGYLDTLAGQNTALHRLDPRTKLLTTAVFIVVVVSFGKYEISALMPFIFYPLVLMGSGKIPPAYIARKIILVSPFAVLVGIFNPLLDQSIAMRVGELSFTGGWVSFASILIRFTLTVGAAMILVAVTGFNAVCMALEKLGTPRFFALQLLFLYRYLFVLVDEAASMVRARSLRVFNGKGLNLKAYASLLGHLLLRTLNRAQRIHSAMWCRGFNGHIKIMRPLSFKGRDYAFMTAWVSLFILWRFVDIPFLLGEQIARLMG